MDPFAHRQDSFGNVTRSFILTHYDNPTASKELLSTYSLDLSGAATPKPAPRECRAAAGRAAGAVLGMAVGDALGAPLEFMSHEHAAPRLVFGIGDVSFQSSSCLSDYT